MVLDPDPEAVGYGTVSWPGLQVPFTTTTTTNHQPYTQILPLFFALSTPCKYRSILQIRTRKVLQDWQSSSAFKLANVSHLRHSPSTTRACSAMVAACYLITWLHWYAWHCSLTSSLTIDLTVADNVHTPGFFRPSVITPFLKMSTRPSSPSFDHTWMYLKTISTLDTRGWQ